MIDLPGKVLQQTESFLATGFRGGFLKGNVPETWGETMYLGRNMLAILFLVGG